MKKGLRICLLCLLMLIMMALAFCGGMYFVNLKQDKLNNNSTIETKDSNEIVNNESIITENTNAESISDDDAKYLYTIFLDTQGTSSGIEFMKYDKDVLTIDDLSNDELFDILKQTIKSEDWINYNPDGGSNNMGEYQIPLKTFKEKSIKYFGKEIQMPNNFYSVNFASCNLSGDMYYCDKGPSGIVLSPNWNYFYINNYVENNTLIINCFAAYNNTDGFKIDYNSDNIYCNNADDEEDCLLDNGFDKKNPVKLTFTIDGDNYIFQSISK